MRWKYYLGELSSFLCLFIAVKASSMAALKTIKNLPIQFLSMRNNTDPSNFLVIFSHILFIQLENLPISKLTTITWFQYFWMNLCPCFWCHFVPLWKHQRSVAVASKFHFQDQTFHWDEPCVIYNDNFAAAPALTQVWGVIYNKLLGSFWGWSKGDDHKNHSHGMVRIGRQLKAHLIPISLSWAGAASTWLGCSELLPARHCQGLGHPQLLWVTWVRASSSTQ